ncbi:MAG: kynureninase [Ignavibacteriae bacterium]|nr:kynureninase [Ignavibacteriota bacterium]
MSDFFSLEYAQNLDKNDELREYRNRFHFPLDSNGDKKLYFTGNSLGLQPKSTREYINQELDDWAKYGVDGHFEAKNPWMPYHEIVAEKLARVVGAKPVEVVAMNSLTANLHFLMVSFYRPEGKKRKIVIEYDAFPSDVYAVKSQIKFHGGNPETDLIYLKAREGEHTIRIEDIKAVLENQSDEIALIMLGGVNYYTGQLFNMKAITEIAHKNNIVAGFDLAHAAGNIHLKLHDWGIDFAAWCSYKYLNSGPGGIAGIFVHEKHLEKDLPRFEGWWGQNKKTRFLMGREFDGIRTAEGWQLSNPPIFQLAALNASLDIFEEVGMEKLNIKTKKLTGYLEQLVNSLGKDTIEIITPSDVTQRGCQLSIRVKNADKSLFEELTKQNIISDWREPDVIRVAPVPLYNSYEDCYKFSDILKKTLTKN